MGKRQITRGSELVTCVIIPAKRDSSVESQRAPGDTQGGFGHAPIKNVMADRNDSGSPDVLIRSPTAVTVESSLGQGIYACPANENVGCPHAKEALGRWSVANAAGRQVPRCQCARWSSAGGNRAARGRCAGAGRQGLGREFRRAPRQPQDATALAAHHDPRRRGRHDRHGLLTRPHGGGPQGHLAVPAEGDRRDRGRPLLRARRGRPEGRPARAEQERAERRGRRGRLHAHPAVREERLRGGGRRRPDEGRPGHPADPRPQDPRTEVRDPGRGGAGQEEDPRELPEHHVLRPAGVRRRGRGPALLLQVREEPEGPGGRAPRRYRPVALALRPRQRRGRGHQAAQHRARPHGRRRRHLPGGGRRGQEEAAGPEGQQAQERLHHRREGLGLLLRLRPRGLPERPGLRQVQGGPGQDLEPGRSDHQDHPRPAGPGVGPAVGQGPRQQERRRGDRRDHRGARHRQDPGHGPVPPVRLRQERDPDQPLGRRGDGRRRGLPARFDVQADSCLLYTS